MQGNPVEVDLLIIGGGIQGLTLLHQWEEQHRGSVLLLSGGPLGSGETLHSHGYLHRGYLAPPEQAPHIPAIRESFDWWTAWMDEQAIDYGLDLPVHVDLPDEQLDAVTGAWSRAGLPFEILDGLPGPLRGGSYQGAEGRRIARIHDRLIQPWSIVEKLAGPLLDRILPGELTRLDWDGGTNAIRGCRAAVDGREIGIRPGAVVLAAGRHNQPILRAIRDAGGARPFDGTFRDLNRIRFVPMLLIRGRDLPTLSGRFLLEAPITMMSHPMEDGEAMWVVTLMEGHRSTRDDFSGDGDAVDSGGIRRAMNALWRMVPGLEPLAGALRFRSYLGAKIDHPDGDQRWFAGSGGISNLRFVWPCLWSLAYGAGRAVLEDLQGAGLIPPAGSTRPSGSAPGITGQHGATRTGREERLRDDRRWHDSKEWWSAHGLDLPGGTP